MNLKYQLIQARAAHLEALNARWMAAADKAVGGMLTPSGGGPEPHQHPCGRGFRTHFVRSAGTPTLSRHPILVVDDDPHNLAALRQVLRGHYPLAFANSGEKALAAVRRLSPTLILLDIDMPEMDGYQVCERLKSDPSTEHIPVVFVTNLAEVGNEADGFAAGAVDYITKPISPPIVLARVRNQLSLVRASQLEQSNRDAVAMLASAGHFNDPDTGVHIWRMAAYARALAAACGWPEEDWRMLETAAPMHDTGKIGIPEHILRKPGKLDAGETEVMKTHSRIGHGILSASKAPVFLMAAEVALHHHEKWDGSGYPDALVGAAIPEAARIVAVADVFDALTMERPYKPAWAIERAAATIGEGAGSHFDPELVETFLRILPEIRAIKDCWDTEDEPEHA